MYTMQPGMAQSLSYNGFDRPHDGVISRPDWNAAAQSGGMQAGYPGMMTTAHTAQAVSRPVTARGMPITMTTMMPQATSVPYTTQISGMASSGSGMHSPPRGSSPPPPQEPTMGHLQLWAPPAGSPRLRASTPGTYTSRAVPTRPARPTTLGPPVTVNGANEASTLQVEVARRQAAEGRVRELEALVSRLRHRVTTLEGKKSAASSHHDQGGRATASNSRANEEFEEPPTDDPIDRAICEYLERNPDFPVSIQKVAQNYYVFGDRGTVYVTQRGEHIVVRVGGGFKSLQVFMDERALMVTGDAASALSQKASAANMATA